MCIFVGLWVTRFFAGVYVCVCACSRVCSVCVVCAFVLVCFYDCAFVGARGWV